MKKDRLTPSTENASFDPQPHLERIRTLLATQGTFTSEVNGQYILDVGELEHARLEHQNRANGLWGNGHKTFHEGFSKKADLAPGERIGIIGVGKDATQIEHILDFYPDQKVFVFEINAEKIKGAEAKIRKSNPKALETGKVKFITGDVAKKLPETAKTGKFKMIDGQLVAIHLPIGKLTEEGREDPNWDPISWDRGLYGGAFPTLPRVFSAVSDALIEGGFATISDLPTIEDWRGLPAQDFEKDEVVLAAVNDMNLFIHGNDKFPGAIKLAWTVRGAKPWLNKYQMADVISRHTNGKLQVDRKQDFSWQVATAEGKAPEAIMLSYMAPTIALATRGAIAGYTKALEWAQGDQKKAIEEAIPRLQGAEKALWTTGKKYFEGSLVKGVLSVSPPLVFQVFQKA